ncbi:MAG: hypothetical protein WAO61_04080 [Solirubrobacterales bacterium]
MSESNGIVSIGPAHEHFSADESGGDRRWTTQMVDCIAEALCGDIETRTVLSGSSVISVEHFRIEEDGSSSSFGYTGFLSPVRLMFWRPKTLKVERHSFVAELETFSL